MKRVQNRLWWILGFVLLPSTGSGTVVLEVGLEEMTHSSQVIMHARVDAVRTEAPSGEAGPILTRVTFHALDVLKGTAHVSRDELTVSFLGGQHGIRTMRIPGMPQFQADEEVVVFLETTSAGYALCGLQQGVFRVAINAENGVRTVSRNTSGMGFARFDTMGKFKMTGAPQRVEGIPLKGLLEEVRHYVESETASDPNRSVPTARVPLP